MNNAADWEWRGSHFLNSPRNSKRIAHKRWWNPLRLARPTRGQISVSPAIAKAGTPSGQRVGGPTISRQVEAFRLGGRVVGAPKEAGLVKIWTSSAGSLLQLPGHLIDEGWWHDADVGELSKVRCTTRPHHSPELLRLDLVQRRE